MTGAERRRKPGIGRQTWKFAAASTHLCHPRPIDATAVATGQRAASRQISLRSAPRDDTAGISATCRGGFGSGQDLPRPAIRRMLNLADWHEEAGSVMRVDLTRRFPVPAAEAFAFITDTANWSAFFPNFVRLRDPSHAKWNAAGDTVTVVIRILGRAVDVTMTLEAIEPPKRVLYRSRQTGLPDARHERRFTALPDGFEFGLSVAFDPRQGLRGLYDRFLVKPAVAGALRTTVDNLDRVFGPKPFRE